MSHEQGSGDETGRPKRAWEQGDLGLEQSGLHQPPFGDILVDRLPGGPVECVQPDDGPGMSDAQLFGARFLEFANQLFDAVAAIENLLVLLFELERGHAGEGCKKTQWRFRLAACSV